MRLACQELEAWYLGDLEALAAAFEEPKLCGRLNTGLRDLARFGELMRNDGRAGVRPSARFSLLGGLRRGAG